jgi:hypothetical protein
MHELQAADAPLGVQNVIGDQTLDRFEMVSGHFLFTFSTPPAVVEICFGDLFNCRLVGAASEGAGPNLPLDLNPKVVSLAFGRELPPLPAALSVNKINGPSRSALALPGRP